jgi:DNA-binding IscR family transcriptional regulator
LELLRKTDQALRALRFLESSSERRQTDEIAVVIDASPHYVPQVMAPLVGRPLGGTT